MTDHWTRIRRRWWIIPIALVVALGIAVPLSMGGATSYTSKVALTTYSQSRAPEQDAVLIQSYVDFFNSGVDQNELRARARVSSDVGFTAYAVATGPIMFVAATGTDEKAVRSAASAMANVFRDSINAGVQSTRTAAIAALRQPFLDRIARQDFIYEQERIELSRQIDQLNADTGGRLQELDNAVTVTAEPHRPVPALAVAILVGLLIGVAAAWLLGGWSPRLTRRAESSDALGLRMFDLTARDDIARRLQLRHVVNALAFDDLPSPTVLAITPASDGVESGPVAEQLARIRAEQGADVIVVRTTHSGSASALGVVDVLRSPGTVTLDDALRSTERAGGVAGGVALLGSGHPAIDPYDVMTRENIGELFGQLRKRFSVIVVDCASITTSAETQLLCAAADRTLLVVENDGTSVVQGRRAVTLLAESQAEVFSALVVPRSSRLPITLLRRPSRSLPIGA